MSATAHKMPVTQRRRVSILGATGSIGDSTLRVIEQQDQFDIAVLTAQSNAEKLIALAKKFRPAVVAIGDETKAHEVNSALASLGIKTLAGPAGVEEAASIAADITVAAIVGAAGLLPTMRAIEQGRHVAVANKEALVCAGELVRQACARHGTTLLPVDSEHNAIFQVLDTHNRAAVEKITLTASGGPLLKRPLATMKDVTPAEAINHPKWDMGAKISVDSATMMNKGLELIEAHYLFNMPAQQLEVVIHPQSIVHSLVHYADGSVLAQLGMPDMAIPIAYALGWPQRLNVQTPRLSLTEMGALEFLPIESARFPALALAQSTLAAGASQMIALNAANEIAVSAFLQGKISFTAIVQTVERVISKTENNAIQTLADVVAADKTARIKAQELL